MDKGNPIFVYWWFHLPNLVLAALMYTLLGRVILGMFFDPDSPNYIWRAFVRITDPVVALVQPVTPQAVPHTVVLLFAVVWLFAARVLLLVSLAAFGMLPSPGVSPQ